jgi:hypothetical protein
MRFGVLVARVQRVLRSGKGAGMLSRMGIKAIVRNGRLEFDAPVSFPEGTVLDLVLDDGGDDLDEAERELLHQQLNLALDEVEKGETVSAEEVLAELRARHK